MPDEVLVTIKFKVKKNHVDEFKQEISDVIDEFLDDSIAEQYGEIEVTEE